MQFFFNESNGARLPKCLLNKIEQASLTEQKVLLYASTVDEPFDENDIHKISGLDLNEIIFALQFWRGADVLTVGGETVTPAKNTETKAKKTLTKDDSPNYTGEEIAALFDKNTEIKLLIEQCQSIAGKVFNPHEINKIVGLYDYLGLSAEYIMLVYNYCKSKNKTTVHYVEKVCFNLYDEGVDTDEKLNEYIKYKEQFDSVAGNIRRIFGTSSRALTKKEEEYIKRWTEEWKMSLEMIEYAYELTVNSTAKASMPYANKILEKWYTAGITTVEKAKEESFDYKKAKQPEAASTTSFDDDEFFEAALKRSYENLGKSPTATNTSEKE